MRATAAANLHMSASAPLQLNDCTVAELMMVAAAKTHMFDPITLYDADPNDATQEGMRVSLETAYPAEFRVDFNPAIV